MIETLEKLSENLGVYVNENHKFGTDAILLSRFCDVRKNDNALDLCTGCGIIALHLLSAKSVTAIDIQSEAIELLDKTVSKYNISNLSTMCADLCELKLPSDSFTLITCNPPYKAAGQGIISENYSEKIARHEILCNINDICEVSSRLLKFGGRLCLCNRTERLSDVIFAMKQHKFEPKRLQFVSKDSRSAPWLFLIEGKKGAKPFLNIMPQIYTYDGVKFTN